MKKHKLKVANYIVFDVETGGLDKKKQEHAKHFPITEIAMITLRGDNLEELDRIHKYIKGIKKQVDTEDDNIEKSYVGYQGLVYQRQALQFTGNTVQKLEEKGENWKQVASDIADFLKESNLGSHLHKPILVGHNVTYDIPFLQRLLESNGVDLSKLVAGYKDYNGEFHCSFIDTMWLSRLHTGVEGEKHNLQVCCDRMNIDLFDAHTAIEDTQSTADLFKKYALNVRTEGRSRSEEGVSKYRDKFKFQI